PRACSFGSNRPLNPPQSQRIAKSMPSRSTNSSKSLNNLRQRKYILIAEEIPIALQFVVSARNCPPGDCDTISRRRLPPSACKVMLGLRARSVRANAAVWTSPETSPAISKMEGEEDSVFSITGVLGTMCTTASFHTKGEIDFKAKY